MNRDRDSGPGLAPRLLVVGAAVAVMGASLLYLQDAVAARNAAARRAAVPDVAIPDPPTPIAAEARVFAARTMQSPAHDALPRRGGAHARTLATERSLRSYPGAPPRVPHGLTDDEFRTGRCGTCHERGGYSPRFEAYAPTTPHPELVACLQCHAADTRLVGLPLRAPGRDGQCRACHVGIPARFREEGLDWHPAAWPAPARRDAIGVPPIPHPLAMREQCLACHAGPAAVAEIRTTHPERLDCRACHVAAEGTAEAFARVAGNATRRRTP